MKKKMIFLLCMCIALTALAGCVGNKKISTSAAIEYNGDKIYPLQCEDTLTYWMALNVDLSQTYENFGDAPIGKQLEKNTGIKVTYVHPQQGQGNEQLNILIASNDLPDIVQHNWLDYPGGPDFAINEGTVYALNDYIEEFAPNLYNYMSKNPDIDKALKTDAGNYYSVPSIRGEDWLCCYMGMAIRGDWLEQSGLSEPKTISEFEALMEKFKKFAKAEPLYFTPANRSYIMNAYEIGNEYYIDDSGKVKYGPAEPEYKEVLTTLNRWYNNDILHKDAISNAAKVKSTILNGESGAFFGAVVSGIGKMLSAKPEEIKEFSIIPIVQVSKNGEDVPEFSYMEDNIIHSVGTAISTNCQNIELALRWLDYGFTEEGHMLNNFGIEGVSYNMVDGEPKLSDTILNNPDGLSLNKVAPLYLRAAYSGAFVQDSRYVEQSLVYPQQIDAYKKWSNTNMKKHIIPSITLLSEELDKASDIQANISTYVDEMFIKFVTGRESIENFDSYINQLEKFGLSEILKMKQNALIRYNKR